MKDHENTNQKMKCSIITKVDFRKKDKGGVLHNYVHICQFIRKT